MKPSALSLLLLAAACATGKTPGDGRAASLRATEPSDDDGGLSVAVETLRRQLVERGETTARLAGSLTALVTNGRPLDETSRDLAALDAVDLAAANALAQSGLYA
jgi:hypothetical protein